MNLVKTLSGDYSRLSGIKYIISDYDGTLVDSLNVMSESFVDTIKHIKKEIAFSIITGSSSRRVRDQLIKVYGTNNSFSELEFVATENGNVRIGKFNTDNQDDLITLGGLKKEQIDTILEHIIETKYFSNGIEKTYQEHVHSQLFDKFENDEDFKNSFNQYWINFQEKLGKKLEKGDFNKQELLSLSPNIKNLLENNLTKYYTSEGLASIFIAGYVNLKYGTKIVLDQKGFLHGHLGIGIPTFQGAFDVAWLELQKAVDHFKEINPKIYEKVELTRTFDGFDFMSEGVNKLKTIKEYVLINKIKPEEIIYLTDHENDEPGRLLEEHINVLYVGEKQVLVDLEIMNENGEVKPEFKDKLFLRIGKGPEGTEEFLKENFGELAQQNSIAVEV